MGDGLAGPGVSCAQAMSAVESVYGRFEIIDSRYRNFRFKAGDVSADNATSGFFVTGPVGVHPSTIDLALEGVLVEVDGQIVDLGDRCRRPGPPG